MFKRLNPIVITFILAMAVFVISFKYRGEMASHLSNLTTQLTTLEEKDGMGCDFSIYTFPKQALESDTPLPEKVRESSKSVIAISVRATLNGSSMFYSPEIFRDYGTGFKTEKGYITARHIFFSSMIDNELRFPFAIDGNGLPISSYYTYEFCGTADVNGKPFSFPLKLVGMGDPYLPKDFAILEAVNVSPQLKSLEFEENPDLGDKPLGEELPVVVYSSGRIPYFNPRGNDINPIKKSVLLDFINYTFTGHISAILTDMENNEYSGLKKIYRIVRASGNIEPGYSGGPVFDKNGKVIGMSVFLSHGNNFSHAISATDLKIFLQNLKHKKP